MSADKYPCIFSRQMETIVYIFTEPEENNCFSIITQVIIRTTGFSFILFVSSSKTSLRI